MGSEKRTALNLLNFFLFSRKKLFFQLQGQWILLDFFSLPYGKIFSFRNFFSLWNSFRQRVCNFRVNFLENSSGRWRKNCQCKRMSNAITTNRKTDMNTETQIDQETTNMTKEQATQILRKAFPKMRRTGSTAIIHSGGRQTIFGCVCGSRHTCSTDWNGRESKHVQEWQAEHENCALKFADAFNRGEEIEVSFGR